MVHPRNDYIVYVYRTVAVLLFLLSEYYFRFLYLLVKPFKYEGTHRPLLELTSIT